MKRIGIDARLYFQTGVGVYLRNLLFYLQKSAPKNFLFYVYLMREDSAKIKFSNKNFVKKEVSYKWHSFSEQVRFAKVLLQNNLDLIHFTYFSYPVAYRRPFIATVHDLTPVLFKTGRASTKNPMVFAFKQAVFKNLILKNQIKNAKKIITPTYTIKRDILSIYGNKFEGKIIPIYEGINYALIGAKQNNKLKGKFRDSFFIYIGNFYPHKNVEQLIEVFAKIKNNSRLILIGPNDFFSKRAVALIKKLNQVKRIILFHTPTVSDFVFFYKNAEALIHPSLSEGFGLPIVEAMYFNLPIIASNIPVFKEIIGDNYLSFDPYSVEDIKDKIEKFIRQKPKFNYSNNRNKYSFERMTKETLEIYKKSL